MKPVVAKAGNRAGKTVQSARWEGSRHTKRTLAPKRDSQAAQLPAGFSNAETATWHQQRLRSAFGFAGGHTATNAPDLFRTPKLTVAGPGQYWGGGPPGKPFGCCRLFLFFLFADQIASGSFNAQPKRLARRISLIWYLEPKWLR